MIIDLNDFLRSSDIFEPYLTCSIIYIPHQISEKIKYANIGDSRVYSISTQYVLQLTIDDSDPIVKNILTRYLGMDDLKKTGCPEIEFTEKNKSHTFLICTDGFYSVMESNPKNLKEIHRLSNLKSSYYIKKGMQKVIVGSNNDDASYVIVRWTNV